MKVQMMVQQPCEIEFNIGDRVVVDVGKMKERTKIRKFVETKYNMYVVFTNGTWRPMTTYGKTWRKL